MLTIVNNLDDSSATIPRRWFLGRRRGNTQAASDFNNSSVVASAIRTITNDLNTSSAIANAIGKIANDLVNCKRKTHNYECSPWFLNCRDRNACDLKSLQASLGRPNRNTYDYKWFHVIPAVADAISKIANDFSSRRRHTRDQAWFQWCLGGQMI